MYFKLFNAITDAINHLKEAEDILIKAQQDGEEMYMEGICEKKIKQNNKK